MIPNVVGVNIPHSVKIDECKKPRINKVFEDLKNNRSVHVHDFYIFCSVISKEENIELKQESVDLIALRLIEEFAKEDSTGEKGQVYPLLHGLSSNEVLKGVRLKDEVFTCLNQILAKKQHVSTIREIIYEASQNQKIPQDIHANLVTALENERYR